MPLQLLSVPFLISRLHVIILKAEFCLLGLLKPFVNFRVSMLTDLFAKTLQRSLTITAALCACLMTSHVFGQAVDNIAIERRGNATVINVRFITFVQYLRHTPPDSGNSLQIYVQLTGSVPPSDLVPHTTRIPRAGDTPEITVRFPDIGNSLRVTFDQSQKFTVSSSPDGRGIVIALTSGAGK